MSVGIHGAYRNALVLADGTERSVFSTSPIYSVAAPFSIIHVPLGKLEDSCPTCVRQRLCAAHCEGQPSKANAASQRVTACRDYVMILMDSGRLRPKLLVA